MKAPLLAVFLCLSFLQMGAHLLGFEGLALFADALHFSPKPDPLAGSQGFEHFEQSIEVKLEHPDGVSTLKLDRKWVLALGGPHRYSVVYLIGLSYAPEHEYGVTNALVQTLFCGEVSARRFGVRSPVRRVTLRLVGIKSNRVAEMAFACMKSS